jgi:molybdopterin/thiamine biosynthesis adenylyltransferase
MNSEAVGRLVSGLKLDGFQMKVTASGLSFRGSVKVREVNVCLRLEYTNTSFTEPPKVFVENPEVLGVGVIGHLDDEDQLCVVDPREYVADRYVLAEHARGLVRRAAAVLEESLVARANPEGMLAEFPRYWGGAVFRVRFGPMNGRVVADTSKDWLELVPTGLRGVGSNGGIAFSVVSERRLSFRKGQTRPNTLGQALRWAREWDPSLSDRLVAGLVEAGPTDAFAVIYAPNGVVGFQTKIPPATARAIRRPAAWTKYLNAKISQGIEIERHQGVRVDTKYILGTNSLSGVPPLAGRNVTLIGCGAVGGFLSFALAQFGAGLEGGCLTLVDSEQLDPRNVARHRLGSESVGHNKAVACRKAINQAIPDLNVSALPLKVENLKSQALRADLLVDATGEEAIGDLLNEWRLERASSVEASGAILHVWVVGNGAAAQTYFSSEPGYACFRCLRPNRGDPERFPVVRDNVAPILSHGCGEASFSPFGPAAPMAAAALASEHSVDWALGRPKPLLRTIRLSYDQTQERKPTNPSKHERCPACGQG